jgi:hypothetical protein
MHEGLPYFMLPDMDFGAKNAEFVPFFGVPAATLTALPRLAASTGAKVVPVIATMLPDYRGWKVTFHPPWENYPGADITAATRQMNAFIEQEILKAPANISGHTNVLRPGRKVKPVCIERLTLCCAYFYNRGFTGAKGHLPAQEALTLYLCSHSTNVVTDDAVAAIF